jgi:hypothetical protein
VVEVDGMRLPEANRQEDTVIMESLVASGRFTKKMEISYCRIYLQAFFISDLTNLEGNTIEGLVGRGQRQIGHHLTWEWRIQQRQGNMIEEWAGRRQR